MTRSAKPKVAFIGLGAMGLGMAIHLIHEGYTISGFDLNLMALEKLVIMGASAASSPKECVEDASFLICMVANAAQTEDVLFSLTDGACIGLKQNANIILCSTVVPDFPETVQQRFRREFNRPDVRVIDCPVSGGTQRAAQGTLTIFSSGLPEHLIEARPVLESLAQNLYIIEGGLGAANKVKLVNQHLAGVHIAISAEVMGLAAKLGLNTDQFFKEVSCSQSSSWMFENRVPHMLADDWKPHSALGIFIKDMGIVTSEGQARHIPLNLATATEQLYLFGGQMGFDKDDDSGIVRTYLANNPSLVSTAKGNQTAQNNQTSNMLLRMLEIVHTATAVEALALGQRIGLQLKDLVPIISTAAGSSESFKTVSQKILTGDFESGSNITKDRDDLLAVINLARGQKYPLLLANTTLQLLQKAVSQGLSEKGQAALIKLWD